MQFIAGVIVGIAVATVGFGGLAKLADKGVAKTQEVVKDITK